VERRTLTLKKRPDPATKPQVDPAKAALSEKLGMRFVDRGGRYIFQRLIVTYSSDAVSELSRTWMDVPLVPEAYGV
jgi:hypothetical protein